MEAWLDDLARTMAGGVSRREVLRRIGGGLVAALLAYSVPEPAEARKKGGTTCPTGQTACPTSPPSDAGPTPEKKSKGGSTACTNLNSDPNNCGACGNKCAAGQNCGGGRCCPNGQANCSGACVQTQNDPQNCGACGTKCVGGQSCVAGVCTTAGCPAGQTTCGGACRNLQTDNANCGACGTACDGGQSCQNGQCVSQQASCNPPCSGGKTCQNGQCLAGGTCTVRHPSDQTVTVDFSSQSTFNGKILALQQTTSQASPSGHLTDTLVISLAGAVVLRFETQSEQGSTHAKLVFGEGYHGIQQSTATNDGQMIRGDVDGHPIVPLPVGADPSTVKFVGGPPPALTADPGLHEAVSDLLKQVQPQIASCIAQTSRPTSLPRIEKTGGDVCQRCEDKCARDGELCFGAVLASCIAVAVFSFGFGGVVCGAGEAALCDLHGVMCLNDCDEPGGPCCPVSCPDGFFSPCCDTGQVCAPFAFGPSSTRTVCCPPGITACNEHCCKEGQACTGTGVCCRPDLEGCGDVCCFTTEACVTDGKTREPVCCPKGVVSCSGVCCHVGEECTPQGHCCQPKVESCRGTCCQPGEKCSDEGICCSPLSVVCRGACCRGGEICRSEGICCPALNAICSGVCCGTGEVCHQGTCCLPDRRCGGICCNPFERCVDPIAGTCCLAGQAACGTKCCPRPDDVCIDGACCPKGQACGPACCPSNRTCQDFNTGACASTTCKPDEFICTTNPTTGVPVCCPNQGGPCCSGQCCALGELCCFDPPRCSRSCIR